MVQQRVIPGLVIAGLAAVVGLWLLGTPFGGSPDELDHHLRALSVGRGELVGTPRDSVPDAPLRPTCCEPGNPSARRWVALGARTVTVPPALDPVALDCTAVVAKDRHPCEAVPGPLHRLTLMGTLEPGGYVLGGLLSGLTSSASGALLATRLGTAAPAVVLLGLAVVVSWRASPRWPTLLGILLATTPGTLFLLGTPSPNALEAVASVTLVAGILAVGSRASASISGAEWAAVAAGAATLSLVRSLGPVWVVLLGLLAALAVDGPTLRAKLRRHRRGVVATFVLAVAASASTVAWEVGVQPHVRIDGDHLVDQLGPSASEWPTWLTQWVGSFGGGFELPLPVLVVQGWGVAVIVLAGMALAFGGRRQRLVLAGGVALAAVVGVLLSSAVLRQNGFMLQGRHLLPILLCLPVLAGHCLSRAQVAVASWARAMGAAMAMVVLTGHLVGLGIGVAGYRDLPGGGVAPRPNTLRGALVEMVQQPQLAVGSLGALGLVGLGVLLSLARPPKGSDLVKQDPDRSALGHPVPIG